MGYMVKYIKGFLETKNIEWIDQLVFEPGNCIFRKAKEEDFNGKMLQIVKLQKSDGNTIIKTLFVNENTFLVFGVKGRRLENDLTIEWKDYMAKTPREQERLEVNLEKVSREDVKMVIEKGDDDQMPRKIKSAIFNGEELDEKSKEKFEEFKADLEADNVDLI